MKTKTLIVAALLTSLAGTNARADSAIPKSAGIGAGFGCLLVGGLSIADGNRNPKDIGADCAMGAVLGGGAGVLVGGMADMIPEDTVSESDLAIAADRD